MRYILNNPVNKLPIVNYDVVIVGAGLSGLYAALSMDKRLKIAVIAKTRLLQCNSSLAQGGIASAVKSDDSPEIHLKDTMRASAGMADENAVRLLAESGPAQIARLVELGVVFDTDADGNWHTTFEGAHRRKRVLHIGGDATGLLMMKTLIRQVSLRENITVYENHSLTDILTDHHQSVSGIVLFHKGFRIFRSRAVVLATGGAGGVYRYSTNNKYLTGDGIAAAWRAGAQLKDMKYVQFHPTALFFPHTEGSLFLISEAVRGEGAVLRNAKGRAFMAKCHQLKDLAPRDIVAREIFRQMEKYNVSNVHLDISHQPASFLRKRFPTIYNKLKEQGIAMERDFIPVVPAQHYLMGGIRTDLNGHTTISGLFAVGEAACTGVHGANRLASNSLLECVVFAAQIAQTIESIDQIPIPDLPTITPLRKKDSAANLQQLKDTIRKTMHQYGGILRSPQGLVHATDLLSSVIEKLKSVALSDPEQFETLNMGIVAREILLSALAERESSGAHYLENEKEEDILPVW